ncbi:MAG TPA: galactitol-1-phosphate 5-dehydrogenase [Fimbriimonadaceae bacterium]|nr:galactitol-1-phosphate 5-dehydrogenase [Fimbriimonadaceae bacterium]
MKALELVEYNRFELVELPVPEPAADEVLIRVRACGICGSDVHGMDGSTGRRIPPIVMGHEASGDIVEVGAAAEGWHTGDRVTFDSTIFCGACGYCRAGQINLCDNRQVLGVSCGDYRRQGAFAEYVAVPARVLCRLPEGLSYERAAMVEPVAVSVHGVARASVTAGDRVAVIGSGMIGLLVIQVLKAKGVNEVVAVDIDPAKLESARALGADRTAASTAGEELDVAIEAVGVTPAVDMALNSVRKGGRVSLIGNFCPSVDFPLQVAVTRELTVFGSCASQGDYPESLNLIASGKVNVDPMISARIGLDQAAEYFARLHAKEPGLMKVMVCP